MGVDGHLNLGQYNTPLVLRQLLLSQQATQTLLKGPVHSLCLSICLGVMAGAKDSLGAQQAPQLTPERPCKPGIPVIHNVIWHPKQCDNVGEEQLSYLLPCQCPLTQGTGYKPCELGQAVQTSKDGIVAIT